MGTLGTLPFPVCFLQPLCPIPPLKPSVGQLVLHFGFSGKRSAREGEAVPSLLQLLATCLNLKKKGNMKKSRGVYQNNSRWVQRGKYKRYNHKCTEENVNRGFFVKILER